MNEYDSDLIRYYLISQGLEEVESELSADLIIYNTCAVRKRAEDKVLGRLGQIKHRKGGRWVIVVGCMAQHTAERLVERYGVDIVIGTTQHYRFSNLAELLKNRPAIYVDFEPRKYPIFNRSTKVSAYLPIQSGCSYRCTFCIVPNVRGPQISRPPQDIIKEARWLIEQGYKEIVLLGQTVSGYGKDIFGWDKTPFIDLLKELVKLDGVLWYRYTSPHPRDFNDVVIEFLLSSERIERHVHLPLQSGSDKILKLMGRGYTIEQYLHIVRKFRELDPEISITTDIIVGFPGETEEDFQRTLDVVKQVEFDQAFMFAFSPRPGTKAALMPDQVPKPIRMERLYRLIRLQNSITERKNRSLIGKVLRALVMGPSVKDSNMYECRTSSGKLIIIERTPDIKPGDILEVKITDAKLWGLIGEPLPSQDARGDPSFSRASSEIR